MLVWRVGGGGSSDGCGPCLLVCTYGVYMFVNYMFVFFVAWCVLWSCVCMDGVMHCVYVCTGNWDMAGLWREMTCLCGFMRVFMYSVP